jgi:hypothetical protein
MLRILNAPPMNSPGWKISVYVFGELKQQSARFISGDAPLLPLGTYPRSDEAQFGVHCAVIEA